MTAWSVFALLALTPAHAVSLHNKDSVAYRIEVMAKSVRRQHELAPGKTLTGFCKTGCIIRLNGSADGDYELEGSERVSIEGGLVYYDGEEFNNGGSGKKKE